MGELQIIEHVVEAHPEQQLSRSDLWRWGPPFDDGRWAVYHGRAAIRVRLDRRRALLSEYAFNQQLRYWLEGQDKVDDQLRVLGALVTLPERVTVPAGPTFSASVPVSIEDTLTELNEKARRELGGDRHPAPEDCPEPGTWVRAAVVDDDMAITPVGKWHHATGWNGRYDGLGLECWQMGRNRTINRALSNVDSRWHKRSTLLRSAEQPTDDACRQCVTLRDKRATSGDR